LGKGERQVVLAGHHHSHVRSELPCLLTEQIVRCSRKDKRGTGRSSREPTVCHSSFSFTRKTEGALLPCPSSWDSLVLADAFTENINFASRVLSG
jgi:hypothetical protein